MFTVTKLDRAFRSVPDAGELISGLAARGVKFGPGGSLYDWNDPFGKMFPQMLAVFAEFGADLIKLGTRQGMARAKAKGKLKGGKPKLNPRQAAYLIELHSAGEHSISELFDVARPTVYRTLARSGS